VPLRVFQDFFVDLDMPLTLTKNDEVSIPATVYNYLKEDQTVTLDLQPEAVVRAGDGLGMKRGRRDEGERSEVVSFRLRAKKVGHFR